MKHYKAVKNCRLCGSRKQKGVLDLGEQALSGTFPMAGETVLHGPLTLLQCDHCGLVQLGHDYDLTLLYGENYGYRSGLNKGMVAHLKEVTNEIETRVKLEPNDVVVDIGSNDGTLLGTYDTPYLHRIGVDPTAEKFREFYPASVKIVPEFFSVDAVKHHLGYKLARVVTSIACFYDLKNPIEFAEGVSTILSDDGIWVLEQSYLPAMLKNNAYDTVCHEHLEYYAMDQIRIVADYVGLKILSATLNDTNGGSFRVTLGRQGESDGTSEKLIFNEMIEHYGPGDVWSDFRANVEKNKFALMTLLDGIKFNKMKILGYGASTKGNVLLQYCGIDNSHLDAIAEINSWKYGRLTPGTNIPIVSEQDARSMNPDFYLVLPWHFRDGIVKREKKFLERGGGLIFPLPQLEVVSGAPA